MIFNSGKHEALVVNLFGNHIAEQEDLKIQYQQAIDQHNQAVASALALPVAVARSGPFDLVPATPDLLNAIVTRQGYAKAFCRIHDQYVIVPVPKPILDPDDPMRWRVDADAQPIGVLIAIGQSATHVVSDVRTLLLVL